MLAVQSTEPRAVRRCVKCWTWTTNTALGPPTAPVLGGGLLPIRGSDYVAGPTSHTEPNLPYRGSHLQKGATESLGVTTHRPPTSS